MATTTTRLALTKPAGTDVVDIDVLNANADKIDAAVGAYICTSTTRPSTPYAGQIIYETDTKLTWKYSGGWKLDTGIQPVVASASARNAIFPSPVVGDSVWRSDLGYSETYYAASGSPARPAGWYSGLDGGLVPIVPTSVSVGSGSASVSGSGVVTFTGITSASYLSLNGVFTSTYSDYKIIIAPTLTAGTSDLFARFRYNGTDYSGGVYGAGAGAVYSSSTLVTYGLFNNATNMALGPMGAMQSNHEVTASPRTGNASIKWHSYAPHSAQSTSAGYNQAVTSRPDGFTILPGASSIAGTIQVYGYRN